MLKDEIKKKMLKNTQNKFPELTGQTNDTTHDIRITS